jgi:pimeloyl-ACP methyl ester carboxylesterase
MNIVILPGAGMSGRGWRRVADDLEATVIPMPDRATVEAMADGLATHIRSTLGDGPVVALGASLGAMVALELTWRLDVAGMVLLSAGFGIPVGERVLERLAAPRPNTLSWVAANGLGRSDDKLVRIRQADFESRGVDVLYRQLSALGRYAARAPHRLVPSIVIQGSLDRSVAADAHAALAQACGAALRLIPEVGHSPYLEAPDEVVRWTRFVLAAVGNPGAAS